jgi:hypothetical protein
VAPGLDTVPARELRIVMRLHGRALTIGEHAIDRYLERVKPGLGAAVAADEDLERLIVACGDIRPEPPAWKHEAHTPTDRDRPAIAWLWLGEDIALPDRPAGS